jgi:hypothetical protein
MLNIIWEAINELEDADHILTRLEKAGMLPPCQCDRDQAIRHYHLEDCSYHWEPENE